MNEKLNNKEYIYKNLQFFYENSTDKFFKSVLENFIRNILNDILFNISINDLKDLIKCKENYEYLKKHSYINKRDRFAKSLNEIATETNKNFSNIINKNTQNFLNNDYMCDVIEDIIY